MSTTTKVFNEYQSSIRIQPQWQSQGFHYYGSVGNPCKCSNEVDLPRWTITNTQNQRSREVWLGPCPLGSTINTFPESSTDHDFNSLVLNVSIEQEYLDLEISFFHNTLSTATSVCTTKVTKTALRWAVSPYMEDEERVKYTVPVYEQLNQFMPNIGTAFSVQSLSFIQVNSFSKPATGGFITLVTLLNVWTTTNPNPVVHPWILFILLFIQPILLP